MLEEALGANSGAADRGTPNSGSGGGGCCKAGNSYPAGSGGSGVVIIKVLR